MAGRDGSRRVRRRPDAAGYPELASPFPALPGRRRRRDPSSVNESAGPYSSARSGRFACFFVTYHLPAIRPPSVLRPLAKSRKLPGSGTDTGPGASGPAFGASVPALAPAPRPRWWFDPMAWENSGNSAIIATTVAIANSFINLPPRVCPSHIEIIPLRILVAFIMPITSGLHDGLYKAHESGK